MSGPPKSCADVVAVHLARWLLASFVGEKTTTGPSPMDPSTS